MYGRFIGEFLQELDVQGRWDWARETLNISVVADVSAHPQGEEDLGSSCRVVLDFISVRANHLVHATLGGGVALGEAVPCSWALFLVRGATGTWEQGAADITGSVCFEERI